LVLTVIALSHEVAGAFSFISQLIEDEVGLWVSVCECVDGEKGANIISNDPSGQVSKLPPRVHLQAIESASKDFNTVPVPSNRVMLSQSGNVVTCTINFCCSIAPLFMKR
jgi:hypothetical protein